MDKEAVIQQVKDREAVVTAFLAHPFNVQIKQDNDEQQTALLSLICEHPVNNIETLVAHFEAIGHLRGLRRSAALLTESLEDIKEELEKLEKE